MWAHKNVSCVGFSRSRQWDEVWLAGYLLGNNPCRRKVGEEGLGRQRCPTEIQTQHSLSQPHRVVPRSTKWQGLHISSPSLDQSSYVSLPQQDEPLGGFLPLKQGLDKLSARSTVENQGNKTFHERESGRHISLSTRKLVTPLDKSLMRLVS